MKRTIAGIALLAIAAAAVGCETAPIEEPGPAQPTASSGPTVEEIEAARQEAARNLSGENADLAIFASEPLTLPPASPAPTATQNAGDIETQMQAISWACRIGFYGNPTWWSAVFGLQALKSAGLITSYNQCRSVVGSAGALSNFLTKNGRTWQYAVLSFLLIAGGSCACDYVW